MNYKRIYDLLIEKRKLNPPAECYCENHHIIPKCMGGTDDSSNLVKLTAREHYIAHQLLYKAYKTTKLAHAWFMMLRCDPNQERIFTARQYEAATLAHVSALKESMKGEGNHFFNKNHSDTSRKKISDKGREWYKNNKKPKEVIDNWVEKVAKKPKTSEHKAKIARNDMVMLKNFDTGESIRIHKDNLHEYDLTIWKNPATIQKKEKCIYCGKESTAGNIKRWHNDNCKEKQNGMSVM